MAAVRAVYADLDARPVERACEGRTDCCRFRITGRTPYVTRGEALVAARALRASGRRGPSGNAASAAASDARRRGDCPLLDGSGRCSVYEARPFACRTHFCAAAGGPYARGEVRDLIHRLEEVDGSLGGDGAKALPIALAEALEERR
jgi:Fe-S-cluster containining protein